MVNLGVPMSKLQVEMAKRNDVLVGDCVQRMVEMDVMVARFRNSCDSSSLINQ